MTKYASPGNIEIIEGSMNQLNLEADSDDIDFWGEDEILNDRADAGIAHSSMLNREWNRRHDQFHTMGYRDGITAGQEASAQEGFNVGYEQSVHHGYKLGLVRGVSSAYANLPDHLKEKLAGTVEKKDRYLNLYQSSHTISTTDALKMFYERLQLTETSKESSESNSHLSINGEEGYSCDQLDVLCNELISLLHDSGELDVKIEPGQATRV